MLLELHEVTKRYETVGDGDGAAVLSDVELQVDAGQSLSIIGPSGSGKTTLLNIIGTLDRPTSGRVLLEDDDLVRMNDRQLAHVRNTKIGFIFQSHHLLPQLTVLENVLVPTVASGSASSELIDRGRSLLDRVGLGHRIGHRPGQLSGGERQRVAVVRSLINRPRLLLADEPTGSLDQQRAGELAELLVELNKEEQVTLIVVTHSLELAGMMNRQYELRGGGIHERQAAPAGESS